MSDQKKRTLLALEIASTIAGTAFRQRAARILSISATRQLLLTSIALVAIQPGNVRALTIGELQVHSSLGQAFVATTVARLAPGEVMSPGCVAAVADMPGGNASPVRLSTTVAKTAVAGEYPVRITSAAPLYEPMYEIQLKVSCPGIAALAKNYVVMLNVGITNPLTQAATNPPEALRTAPVSAQPVAAASRQTSTAPVTPEAQAIARPEPAPDIRTGIFDPGLSSELTLSTPAPATDSSIPTGSKYRVQRGDTLLTIAQRIEGRAGLSTRQFAEVLLQENPSAFIDGNPDLIKMGFVITIPGGQSQPRFILLAFSCEDTK